MRVDQVMIQGRPEYTLPKEGRFCAKCPLFKKGTPVMDRLPDPEDFCGLTLVGEGPGAQEIKKNVPFIGASGGVLWPTLDMTVQRSEERVHATNCVRCGLKNGTKPSDGQMKQAIECCLPAVIENMLAMGTKTVCAIGSIPFEALTGLKGIDKYRGTVIPPEDGRPFYITSTLHPAGLLRVESRRVLWSMFQADLAKAYRLATGEIGLWEPEVRDGLILEDVLDFLEEVQEAGLPLVCDVETTVADTDVYNLALQSELLTIGIGAKMDASEVPEVYPLLWPEAYPEMYQSKKMRRDWARVEAKLKEMLTDPKQRVVFHNFPFDVPVLENGLGIEVTADVHDTLLLHHAIYPKLPKKLQQVASQFLAVEAWKDDFRSLDSEIGKLVTAQEKELDKFLHGPDHDPDEDEGLVSVIQTKIDDLTREQTEELLWYNGCDVGATAELFHILEPEAREFDVWKVYEIDRALLRETLAWTRKGILVDMEKRGELIDVYKAEVDGYYANLLRLCALPEPEEIEDELKEIEKKISEASFEYVELSKTCDICGRGFGSKMTLLRHVRKEHPTSFQSYKKFLGEELPDLEVELGALKKLRKEIKKRPTNKTFNPASIPQLLEVLSLRGVRPIKLTKKGNISTAKDALWEYRDDEFVDTLFRWREKTKLLSTYLVNLPKRLGPDGRIHPVWKLHATPSGRFGTQPAVQNWPKKMKEMMVARPGWKIVGADYSALELRLSALLAGQEDLIEAFNNGEDIHARHASWFFPTEWEEADETVRAELRGFGKSVTFGKIYRAGANTLYENVREHREDVKTPAQHKRLLREVARMSAVLDNKYPKLGKSALHFMREAMDTLVLRTYLIGRARRWPMGAYPPCVSLNEAANHPIQGLAADAMNLATLRLAKELKRRKWYGKDAFIILQVHDALYVEAREGIANEVAKLLQECLEFELTVKSNVTKKKNTMFFPAEPKISDNVRGAA